MTLYPGPTPAYTNPPIKPQYFKPSAFPITGITLGTTTTITTGTSFGVSNNYAVGQLVRLLVPETYGTFQLNNQTGYVTATATNQVTVNIDTTIGYSAFITSPSYKGQFPPQIVAIGDVNSGPINSGRSNQSTLVSGSFQNISPST